MKKIYLIGCLALWGFFSCSAPDHPLSLKTDFFHLQIDSRGNIVMMADLIKDENFLHRGITSPLLSISQGGEVYPPEEAIVNPENKHIILKYDDLGTQITIQYQIKSTHASFEVIELSADPKVDFVVWGPFQTKLGKIIGETVGVVQGDNFALGIQALNIKTLGGYPSNPDDTEPAYDIFATNSLTDVSDSVKVLYRGQTARPTESGSILQAYTRDRSEKRIIPVWNHERYSVPAYEDGGIIGSKIALFGGEPNNILNIIGKIEVEESLPHPKINGEWIKTAPEATSSYLIMPFGVDNMDKALALTKKAGLRYLYHGDPFDTWGHFKLLEESFPDNWESMRQLVERASQQGIQLGVHTLSNFISTDDAYVTPVPDRRLAAVGTALLNADIGADTKEIPLDNPGYFNQMNNNNLHTVRIGNELIRYESVSQEAPWILLNCERGAFDTHPSSHQKGDTLSKLMDHGYRVFLSDVNLSREIATTIADFCNTTGIRQISFDGLEGNWASGMGQYSRQLFVQTWYEHLKPELKGEIINDASNPGHYFWHIFTRMNWGEPWYAGFRESQTQYRLMNQDYFDRNLMPNMLGWFSLSAETSLMDVEWLLARAAGFDAGFALSTSYEALDANGHSDRILEKISIWEKARLSGAFEEDKKEFLKDINKEFTLQETGESEWNLREVYGQVFHLANKEKQPGEPLYHAIDFTNNFGEQPLQMIISATGEGKITKLKLELNNFIHLELPVNISQGNILVYEEGEYAVLYDKEWNILKTVPLDGSKLSIPMGLQRIRVEMEGSKGVEGKIELKVLGEKVLIKGKKKNHLN